MIETNIMRQSLPVFLSEGAFLRHPDGTCILAMGPAKALKDQENSDFTWYAMEFFASKPQRIAFAQVVKISQSELRKILQEYLGEARPKLPIPTQEPSLERFSGDLQEIMRKIQSGEIDKAVPIVEQTWAYVPDSTMKAHLILQSLLAPSNLYPYGIWSKEYGFIGATPELLLQTVGENRISTMALAGTLPKSDGRVGKMLLADLKEMNEHQKVISDIKNQLAPFGKVEVGNTEVVELPKLYHLKTEIQLQASQQYSLVELIQAMHPTAALGVYPRSGNGIWYNQLSYQKNRDYFGAPFGVQEKEGKALVLVSIRNLSWNKTQTQLRAGCGIVSQSNMQSEWQELANKREATLHQLGLL